MRKFGFIAANGCSTFCTAPKGVACLDPDRPPPDVPRHRWRQFVDDCKRFLNSPENWAEHAARLGWDAMALFGCAPRRPLDFAGSGGLMWAMNGGRCCWSARSCRRCLRLGLRRRGLRRGDGNAVEPPLVSNHLEHEIEIDLLRPRRDVAGQMQHAALIERGHDCELRRQQCRTIEIEIATSQVGKALPKIGGGVARLKIGRGKVALLSGTLFRWSTEGQLFRQPEPTGWRSTLRFDTAERWNLTSSP